YRSSECVLLVVSPRVFSRISTTSTTDRNDTHAASTIHYIIFHSTLIYSPLTSGHCPFQQRCVPFQYWLLLSTVCFTWFPFFSSYFAPTIIVASHSQFSSFNEYFSFTNKHFVFTCDAKKLLQRHKHPPTTN